MIQISKTICGLMLVAAAVTVNAADFKERSFKFAFTQPKDSSHGLGAQHFADLLEKKSGGKMKVRTFGSGTLGGEAQVLSALQGGTVEISVMAPALLVGNIKEYVLWDLPFLFTEYAEAEAVMDGRVGSTLLERLPARGLVGLAYWEHGFRNLTNNKRPVAKVEDIEGLKIRVLQNPLYVDVFKALGANAVPLPFPELYAAMESRAVDGQEQPYASIAANKFDEVQKFLSVTRHIYNPLLMLISKKTWDQLSPDEQRVMKEAAVETTKYQRNIARDLDNKALADLKTRGMVVTEMSAGEIARMREKVKPVLAKYAADVGETLYKQVEEDLRKARTK